MSNWLQYFCNVNHKFSSILVDVDLKDLLPDDKRPDLIWIWIYMNAPRTDGLSSNEEFETLNTIEDALTVRLEKDCGACLAGRITGDGRREFYYYGRRPLQLERIVEEELANFPGYRFDCDTQPDPAWRQYLDVLYPSEENLELLKNAAVLENLSKAGDDPEVVRPVWHYVWFESAAGRERFLEWSKENGFEQVQRGRAGGQNRLEPGMVCVVRSHSATPDEINNYVLKVFGAARQFGGKYDGWETRVEGKPRPHLS